MGTVVVIVGVLSGVAGGVGVGAVVVAEGLAAADADGCRSCLRPAVPAVPPSHERGFVTGLRLRFCGRLSRPTIALPSQIHARGTLGRLGREGDGNCGSGQ